MVVVDALHDTYLHAIAEACAPLKLVTGGSGIALGLPENFRRAGLLSSLKNTIRLPHYSGRSVVLAGSTSRKFVVAGGETSGAVVQALEVRVLRIGQQIAPGVPATQSIGDTPLLFGLKSGNFGGPDFFEQAITALNEES